MANGFLMPYEKEKYYNLVPRAFPLKVGGA